MVTLQRNAQASIFEGLGVLYSNCPRALLNRLSIMRIVIFGNSFKRNTIDETAHILCYMREHKVEVMLSKEIRDEMNLRDCYPLFSETTQEDIDFAISIGGDGTFLTTAAHIGAKNIPILGINLGHLGFLSDVQASDVDRILDQLINNNYTIEQRSILKVTNSEGAPLSLPFALNEVAVMKQELSSMIAVDTYVNGEMLNTYNADGLIVSTPTGSTAYNLSVGGPIVAPQTKVIVLSPIASHSLNVRPLIIPDDCTIDLKISSRSHNYLISIDGRSLSIKESVKLHIEKAHYTIKLVQLGEHSFFDSLKKKLSWGTQGS